MVSGQIAQVAKPMPSFSITSLLYVCVRYLPSTSSHSWLVEMVRLLNDYAFNEFLISTFPVINTEKWPWTLLSLFIWLMKNSDWSLSFILGHLSRKQHILLWNSSLSLITTHLPSFFFLWPLPSYISYYSLLYYRPYLRVVLRLFPMNYTCSRKLFG